MPQTRRDKEISLTKVKKKSRENKENLVEQIRKCVDEYASVYSFSIENLRSSKFIQIRQKFKKTSKFFFGKRNVMALALGRTAGEEISDGIHKLSKTLEGQCGLIFTNEKEKDFIKYFKTFDDEEFARSGNTATHSVHLPAGPLTQFPFSMEPQLKRLGLPCKVERGFVELYDSFQVCSEGDTLTADQCKILKLLGEKMATFKVNLIAKWSKSKGFVTL
uniref:Ribosome assembly factor mrt4 n=1 Tax=Bursaphelenchus xylophilus TaxID=6326 RepID=A0A1I7SMA8_BURXY